MAQIATGWKNYMTCLNEKCGGRSFKTWTYDYNMETQALCNGCGQYYDFETPDKLGDPVVLTPCDGPNPAPVPKEEKNWDGLQLLIEAHEMLFLGNSRYFQKVLAKKISEFLSGNVQGRAQKLGWAADMSRIDRLKSYAKLLAEIFQLDEKSTLEKMVSMEKLMEDAPNPMDRYWSWYQWLEYWVKNNPW